MEGILVVNKEKGCTSRDVVNKVSKILGEKRIGHTGTLDPIACGVLVLCIGKATKLVEILTSDRKKYEAEVTLGISTDTLDNTGTILKREKVCLKEEEIKKALFSMVGSYEQEVPLYSAVKVQGKKLYDYAREGKDIILPKRMVHIYQIDLLGDIHKKGDLITFRFSCEVSKGTYIRSLIRDIALKLNTIGMMSNLIRIQQGIFSIEEAYSLKQMEEGKFSFVSIERVLDLYPSVIIEKSLEKKVRNGILLKNIYEKEKILFRDEQKKPIALYHCYSKDPTFLKPWKMF